MKKALIVVAIVALGAWIIIAILGRVVPRVWAKDAVAASGARPWPGGMGTIDSVAARFPPLASNAAAVKLTALANALPKDDAVDDFVGREVARGEIAIGEPPALPDVTAMRELLLRAPIRWERPGGVGDVADEQMTGRRGMQMRVARALVASALAKARAHDPAAWEELHAVWNLARSLDEQPQPQLQTAAFSMARTINAVAWKLPLPAPPWLAELQQRDDVRRLLAAFQFQVASYWKEDARILPTTWLADSVEKDRRIAESLFNETRCDVTAPRNDLGVDLSSVWRRAFRFRAEREATANALRVRQGKPIETRSRCSDGAWTFDGTTLRFSRDIATTAPDRPMPLVLRLKL
jgi:hypothetical protein